MKKTLLIGSTCVDVIMNVKKMPQAGDDMLVQSQEHKLGGCTFNISDIMHHFEVPYTLCSPVGTGLYGDFVTKELEKRNVPVFARINDKENGCCYCVVDQNGERTFLCEHGAEYVFRREFFDSISLEEIDSVFICGLELEEPTAKAEVDYVQELYDYFKAKNEPFTIYFAPGPRIENIDESLLERVLDLHPVIHLNK